MASDIAGLEESAKVFSVCADKDSDITTRGFIMKFSAIVGKKEMGSFGMFNLALQARVRGKTGPRYHQIDTNTVLAAVERVSNSRGMGIQSIRASATGRKSTKHVVRVRFDALQGTGNNQYFPELVIYNSYDGEQSLRISTGMFRLICSNGLTIGEGISEHVRVKHISGQKVEDFKKNLEFQIAACLDALGQLNAAVQKYTNMELPATVEQRLTEFLHLPKRAEATLRDIRGGSFRRDTEPNLWAYYNAVNEALRVKSRSEVGNEYRNMNLLDKIEASYVVAMVA